MQLLPSLLSRCYRCHKATDGYKTCISCRRTSSLHAVYVCSEYETAAKILVQKLKFERTYAAAHTIAQAMGMHLGAMLPDNLTVAFVPTATSRVRQRGYDQSQLIAKELAHRQGLPYRSALFRVGQQRQTNSSRRDRLQQMHNAFVVRPAARQTDHILLVDDVMTTGATLESAAQALQAVGVPKVSAMVFARAT